MIVFCCVLPASNKARDDDDDDYIIVSVSLLTRAEMVYTTPAVSNSLPMIVLESLSLTVFKSRLKTHLFNLAHTNV